MVKCLFIYIYHILFIKTMLFALDQHLYNLYDIVIVTLYFLCILRGPLSCNLITHWVMKSIS